MRKTLGIIMSLLLVGVAFVGIFAQNLNSTKKESRHEADSPVDITKLCVTVSCGEYYGCGTIYDSDDSSFTIVTAEHVLQDYFDGLSTDITVTFYDHETFNASILKKSDELDIVFLNIEGKDLSEVYHSVTGSSVQSATSLTPGETIYFVDANTSDTYAGSIASPSVYSEDFGMDMIYCYCQVTPGMSGTGLFSESGTYLGILLGGSDEAEAVCLDATSIQASFQE